MPDNIYLFLGGPLHGTARAVQYATPEYFVHEMTQPHFAHWREGDMIADPKVLRYEKVRIQIGNARLHAYILAGDSIEDRLVQHIMESVKGPEK